jgi:hypothetical protein
MRRSDELVEPVSYSPWLVVLVVALPLVVLAWYVGVAVWFSDPGGLSLPRRVRLSAARRRHLGRLEQLRRAVEEGRVPVRDAHQEISAVVRSFVTETGAVDARSMSLEQLREAELPRVAELVSLVYPPAFAPGEQGQPQERFGPALREAKGIVREWTP